MLWLLLGNFGKNGLLFIPTSGHTGSCVSSSWPNRFRYRAQFGLYEETLVIVFPRKGQSMACNETCLKQELFQGKETDSKSEAGLKWICSFSA